MLRPKTRFQARIHCLWRREDIIASCSATVYIRRINKNYLKIITFCMTSLAPPTESELDALGLEAYPKLSKDAINALPLFHYEGRICLVRDKRELANAVERLSAESVLGFDTETPPCFRKGKTHAPTLVQLAGENEVFLFHLKWQPLGNELISIFENPSIIKTGVAVHDDMRFLAKISPFSPRAVVDLSEIAQRNHVENLGLRGLTAGFLGLRISKSEQCSNWGNSHLTPRQIRYAATDAWASRAVYLKMLEAGLSVTPTSPRDPLPKRYAKPFRSAKKSKRALPASNPAL